MSKYNGLNYVDVKVTNTTVALSSKRRHKAGICGVISLWMCIIVAVMLVGKSLEIPFFVTTNHYVKQAIQYDISLSGEEVDDGKIKFVAKFWETIVTKLDIDNGSIIV